MSDTYLLPGISQPVTNATPIYKGSHFTWGEATMRGSRIPQKTIFDGIHVPAAQITANIVKMARELDRIRDEFGDKPIVINSWYRDPVTNRAIGGATSSQHKLGWGVDIYIVGLYPHQVQAKLTETWAGGLGRNRKYTHLDLRHLMGWEQARWDYGRSA